MTCNGDLDLSGATITVRDPTQLTRPQTIATCTGKATGKPKSNASEANFCVRVGETTVRLIPEGFFIIIR